MLQRTTEKKNERGTRDEKIDGGQFVEFGSRVLNGSFTNLMKFFVIEAAVQVEDSIFQQKFASLKRQQRNCSSVEVVVSDAF
jgi:hypothetical protein